MVKSQAQSGRLRTLIHSGPISGVHVNPAVVRLLVAGQHADGGVLQTGLLDLPGAGRPDAVGVQEQHHHHPGLVDHLIPRILLPVDGVDRLKIQLSGQIEQEEHQVVRRQPIHR
jgi:hypothetical protein